jgi:L-ascorbate metabolism protein UlaG (beta-lactamase superfamily)
MTVIRWLGQACFLITTLMGTQILIDPPHPQVGYHITAHSIPANLVFVSHEHMDHNFTEAAEPINGEQPKIIQPLPLAKVSPDGTVTTEQQSGVYRRGPVGGAP